LTDCRGRVRWKRYAERETPRALDEADARADDRQPSGRTVPVILIALGQDPAQSSSIISTTVSDVVGFFSVLGIATLLAAML
jgi:hypothetical protein